MPSPESKSVDHTFYSAHCSGFQYCPREIMVIPWVLASKTESLCLKKRSPFFNILMTARNHIDKVFYFSRVIHIFICSKFHLLN